jgi:hypothetical protein
MTQPRRAFVASILVLALGGTVFAKTKFKSVWRSPDAATLKVGGKKVAALVIDTEISLRMAGEEALANELTARGMQGVPAYRIVPKEELRDADKAKGWFERSGVEAVVVLRVVNDKQRLTYQPSTWSSPYYTSFWGYYGYGWGAVYDPGYVRDDRIVSLETLIYSVPKNTLMWAGMSETENPKSPSKTVEEVVKEAVKEMKKQGLAQNQK